MDYRGSKRAGSWNVGRYSGRVKVSGNRRFNITGNLAIRAENLEWKLWSWLVNGITADRDNW